MSTKLMLLLVLLTASLSAAARSGEISGRVINDQKQAMVSAIIQVTEGGIIKGKTLTDAGGNYTVRALSPGNKYEVRVSYTGYNTQTVSNIAVLAGKKTSLNFQLKKQVHQIKEVKAVEPPAPIPDHISRTEAGTTTMQTKNITIAAPERKAKAGKDDARYDRARTSNNIYGAAVHEKESDEISAIARTQDNTAYARPLYLDPSTESYKKVQENDFMNVKSSPLSTMSVDVDRASYSNVRRFINEGQKPPADAVRIEEMINYFDYDYPQPTADAPIAIQTELIDCPWQKDHKLLHISMQARRIDEAKLPPSNLVFLVDVSGSMNEADKLPLLKSALRLLVNKLREKDKITMVVYAGSAGMVLPPTSGSQKQKILKAIDKLEAGGSTAGEAGIKLAYKVAKENFIKGGNNRVLLATDGDFNVGVSNENELEDLITKEREKGVFLTCLGFGQGNYKDSKMELLADKGNGNYDYIDNIEEAQKTLVNEFGGTLFTVAKDVKAQIEFNPSKVQAYRLVGYENRLLNTEDFKDDKKDAGDMGSGHTVTILYEIIPAGIKSKFTRSVNELKYQDAERADAAYTDELATIKFRYKKPDGDKSSEIVHTIADNTLDMEEASGNTRFASSVAMFGLLLKDSKYKGVSSYASVLRMAKGSKGDDRDGYRAEFIKLVKTEDEYESKTSLK